MAKEMMLIKAFVSEMDKSTIVSIYPREVKQSKVTVFPTQYTIPAGTIEKPGVLVIGTALWHKNIYESEPQQTVEMPILSAPMAESIVRDWTSSVLEAGHNARPGIFWVLGAKTSEQILKEHKKELEKAKAEQDEWYLKLVRLADIDWVKYDGSPLAVSDSARMAAMALNLDKPWLKDIKNITMGVCPACGTQRSTQFPVCKECHTIIDQAAYAKLGFATVSAK